MNTLTDLMTELLADDDMAETLVEIVNLPTVYKWGPKLPAFDEYENEEANNEND
jgi:hypothetical protein